MMDAGKRLLPEGWTSADGVIVISIHLLGALICYSGCADQ
jgi:hypothetical protein